MKKVRVAVIGAGQFGRNHVRVVRESPSAELVAIVLYGVGLVLLFLERRAVIR